MSGDVIHNTNMRTEKKSVLSHIEIGALSSFKTPKREKKNKDESSRTRYVLSIIQMRRNLHSDFKVGFTAQWLPVSLYSDHDFSSMFNEAMSTAENSYTKRNFTICIPRLELRYLNRR
jgi:hypothetical protein